MAADALLTHRGTAAELRPRRSQADRKDHTSRATSIFQWTAKGASGKGPRQKTSQIVKKCQKYFRHFSTFFAQGKKRQKSSKSVKNFDNFRVAPVFRPLLGGSESSLRQDVLEKRAPSSRVLRCGSGPLSEVRGCLEEGLPLGARLRGHTATQRSKKGSGKGSGEGVLRRVLRRGLFLWVLQ